MYQRAFIFAACFGVLGAAFVTPLNTFGRDIFVDNVGGDDRNDGSLPSGGGIDKGPCQSIGKALRIARPGDRVVLAKTAEPYREAIVLSGARNSGILGTTFTLVGNGAILDGSRLLNADDWEHFRGSVFRIRPHRLTHPQLFLEGTLLAHKPLDAQGNLPDLAALEWSFREGWLYFRPEVDRLPGDYPLAYPYESVGVTLFQVHGVVIDDLIVQGFHLDGIQAADLTEDVTIVSCSARANGRSGFRIGGASRVDVFASRAENNGSAQLSCSQFAKARIWNCTLAAGRAPAVANEGGAVAELTEPPETE